MKARGASQPRAFQELPRQGPGSLYYWDVCTVSAAAAGAPFRLGWLFIDKHLPSQVSTHGIGDAVITCRRRHLTVPAEGWSPRALFRRVSTLPDTLKGIIPRHPPTHLPLRTVLSSFPRPFAFCQPGYRMQARFSYGSDDGRWR